MLVHDMGTAPFRRACERCHGMKLRCQRLHISDDCLRCQRARATCVPSTSKPRRARRDPYAGLDSRHNAPLSQPKDVVVSNQEGEAQALPSQTTHFSSWPQSLLFVSSDLDLDLNFDSHLSTSSFQSAPPLTTSRYASPYGGSSTDAWFIESASAGSTVALSNRPNDTLRQEADDSSRDATTYLKALSQLNIALHHNSMDIPTLEVFSTVPNNLNIDPEVRRETQRQKEVTLDRTLKLSQNLIEILNRLFPLFRTSALDNPELRAPAVLDQPTELLILSSYLALIESYEKIISLIGTCSELLKTADQSSAELVTSTCLPDLSVGSFSISSSSSMQVVILVELMQAMLTRLQDLLDAMKKFNRGQQDAEDKSSSPESVELAQTPAGEWDSRMFQRNPDIIETTFQGIQGRANSVQEQLQRAKKMVARAMML